MVVLCEDIVDESKEPTVPDVFVDKDEMDMNEDYMADWTGIILCWRLYGWSKTKLGRWDLIFFNNLFL